MRAVKAKLLRRAAKQMLDAPTKYEDQTLYKVYMGPRGPVPTQVFTRYIVGGTRELYHQLKREFKNT